MKKAITTFLILLLTTPMMIKNSFGQDTGWEGFMYQAEIRNEKGRILSNTTIDLRISILKTEAITDVEWRKEYSSETDKYGMISIIIGGEGKDINGDPLELSEINWGVGTHYLYAEKWNGSNWEDMGTPVMLMSVPYALYAKSAGSSNVIEQDGDPTNEIQTLVINGQDLSITKGNTITLPANGADADADPNNEIQSLSISDNILSISQANSVVLPAENIKIWSGHSRVHVRGGAWKVYYPEYENFNTLGSYMSNNNGTFTVNEPGYYHINFKATTSTYNGLTNSKLTVGASIVDYGYTNSSNITTLNIDLVWKFSTGNEFKIEVYSTNAADYSIYGDLGTNRLQITYLGNPE